MTLQAKMLAAIAASGLAAFVVSSPAQAVAAQNLVRLSLLAGDDRYRERADKLLDGLLPQAAENLFMHAATLNALDLRLRHTEIVTTGQRADELASAALRLSFLNRTVLRVADADALPAAHPARDKMKAAPQEGAAFVCVGETCSLPVTDPARLAAAAQAAP